MNFAFTGTNDDYTEETATPKILFWMLLRSKINIKAKYAQYYLIWKQQILKTYQIILIVPKTLCPIIPNKSIYLSQVALLIQYTGCQSTAIKTQ